MKKKPYREGRLGRPGTYCRELCSKIIGAMATGLSAEAAAAKIGISARSLFNWQKERPEFLQAIQEGRQRALLWWETRALEMAGGAPGNAQLVILALKNRSRAASGWYNDSQRLEHTGADGGPLVVANTATIDASALPPEDRQELRRVLALAAAACAAPAE